jgi:hypothetical protein
LAGALFESESTMQILRPSVLTIALTFAIVVGFALRATASDNWLIGTWTSATGLTYIFTTDALTIVGPEGKVGPLKVTSYTVDGNTITVTADGLPAKAIAKKTDDTHAVFDNGVDPPIAVTKK